MTSHMRDQARQIYSDARADGKSHEEAKALAHEILVNQSSEVDRLQHEIVYWVNLARSGFQSPDYGEVVLNLILDLNKWDEGAARIMVEYALGVRKGRQVNTHESRG